MSLHSDTVDQKIEERLASVTLQPINTIVSIFVVRYLSLTQQTSDYGSPTQTNRPIKHARAFLSLNRSTGRNVNYINSGKSTSASYQKVNATKRQDRHTANVSNMLSNDCHGCDNYKQQYNSAIEKSADKLRSDLLLCCLSLLVPNCQNVIRRQSKKLRGWKLTYSSKALLTRAL